MTVRLPFLSMATKIVWIHQTLVVKRLFWPSVKTMSRPSSSTDLTKTCQALVSTKTQSSKDCLVLASNFKAFRTLITLYYQFVTHLFFWRVKQSYQITLYFPANVCVCPNFHVFSGPSKSLTFEEGCVGNGEAGAGTESEAPKKVPDPCCPIFCERM